MAGRQVAENDSPWLKNMLATFYGETDHFKDPRLLPSGRSTQNTVTSKISPTDNDYLFGMPQEIQ